MFVLISFFWLAWLSIAPKPAIKVKEKGFCIL